MVEINRREQKPRPYAPKTDSKLRSHSLHNANVDAYYSMGTSDQRVVKYNKARIATLHQEMMPSNQQQSYETYNTRGPRSNQHSRISTQRMLSHFKVNSLAQAQMNKIEGLLKKARGRHDILIEDRDKESSVLARMATDEKMLNKDFESVDVDVRRSLQINTIKHERSLEKSKRIAPHMTNSIDLIAAAAQSYGSHQNKGDKETAKFNSMVPTLRSSFQVHHAKDGPPQYSNRLLEFSEYSVSGIPQKGTERASMLGQAIPEKNSSNRFKNSPLLKDVLLKDKDEKKASAPKKLKPINKLRLSIEDRQKLAKERLKQLPKFSELRTSVAKSGKKTDSLLGRNESNTINIKASNRYDDESQIMESKPDLPTYSKTLLVQGDSPVLSKQASGNMIALNKDNFLAQTQSAKKLERIISLQSFVTRQLDEQHEYAKQRQKSLDSLHSKESEGGKKLSNYCSKLQFLSPGSSLASLEASASSVKNLSPQAKQDIEKSLAVTKSQDKITFRDFSLPPQHGKRRLPERANQSPRAECVISQKIQAHLGDTEKRTTAGDEVNQKLMLARRTKGIDVWKLPMGHRNKIMSENYFEKVQKKEAHLQKPTDVTKLLKNPLHIGSFEGIALRQSKQKLL